VSEALILLGAFVLFSSALGFCRFRDPFQRFHPVTKAGLFGLGILFIGVSLSFSDEKRINSPYELAGLLLLMIIQPFTAHLLSRSFYFRSKK